MYIEEPHTLMKVKVLLAQSCLILCDHVYHKSVKLLCPWNLLGKETGLGSHSLLQGIFLTQGLNPGLLHCRQILHCLSQEGSPYTQTIHHKWVFD